MKGRLYIDTKVFGAIIWVTLRNERQPYEKIYNCIPDDTIHVLCSSFSLQEVGRKLQTIHAVIFTSDWS